MQHRPSVAIKLLGRPIITRDHRPVKLDARPKCIPLLAYLIVHCRERASRRAIALALWPESDGSQGLSNLRRHLHHVLTAFEPHGTTPLVLADNTSLQWNPALAMQCDLVELEDVLAQNGGAERILELYAGDLLEGIDEEWIVRERDHLRARVIAQVIAQLERSAPDDVESALHLGGRLLEIDPFNEEALRRVIAALGTIGRRTEALTLAAAFERRLSEQLEVAPEPQTLALIATLRDPQTAPDALPRYSTSFIGRASDLSAIALALEDSRVVTVAGAGGIGKTRTAIETGRRLASRHGGRVRFADLSLVEGPELVFTTIANAVGAPAARTLKDIAAFARDCPSTLLIIDNCEHLVEACAPIVAAIANARGNLRVLATSREPLAIDGEAVVRLPPLGVPDVRTANGDTANYDAVRLFVERAAARDARFALTEANKRDVVELCSRLDGVPLAIEIAASRAGAIDVAALAASDSLLVRLKAEGDRPVRHHSIEEAFTWSLSTLDPRESALLFNASVFSGQFTAAAAHQVCAPGARFDDVLAHLAALVDKSLLQVDATSDGLRYRMLKTVRAVAGAHLEPEALAPLRARHAALFSAIATTVDADLNGPRDAERMRSLPLDYPDIRATLEWTLSEGNDPALGATMTLLLELFWDLQSMRAERAVWLEHALAWAERAGEHAMRGRFLLLLAERAYVDGKPQERARLGALALPLLEKYDGKRWYVRALVLHAHLEYRAGGDMHTAQSYLQKALSVAPPDDFRVISGVLVNLAHVALVMGNVDKTLEYHEEALRLRRMLGGRRTIAVSLGLIAEAYAVVGRYEEAKALLDEAQAVARDVGWREPVAFSDVALGTIAIAMNDIDAARERLSSALTFALHERDSVILVQSMEALVCAAAAADKFVLAARLMGKAEALRADTNPVAHRIIVEQTKAASARMAQALDADSITREKAFGRALSIEALAAAAATL